MDTTKILYETEKFRENVALILEHRRGDEETRYFRENMNIILFTIKQQQEQIKQYEKALKYIKEHPSPYNYEDARGMAESALEGTYE